MRTVLITRVHNSYRIGVNNGGNGFTYTDGFGKDGITCNSLFDNGSFKFHGAPGIPDGWFPNDYERAEELAIEIAIKANLAYGFPILVVNHKKKLVYTADAILFDEVTQDYLPKEELSRLINVRNSLEDIKRARASIDQLIQNKNNQYESELR